MQWFSIKANHFSISFANFKGYYFINSVLSLPEILSLIMAIAEKVV